MLTAYGGQVEGKTIEVKIGAVAAGTRPDTIPVDLRDDLAQKELRELVEHLEREQLDISRARLSALVVDLDTAAGLIGSQNLDAEAAEKLVDALSRTTAAVRRVQRERRASAPPVDLRVNQSG